MVELPLQFDRHRDTWVQTPSGAILVTPQAGYRYYVRPKNQRAEFVSGFDSVAYVREVAARMGGVLGWNVAHSRQEGEVTRDRLNAVYNKLYAQTDELFKRHNPCKIHKNERGETVCGSQGQMTPCCGGCKHLGDEGCKAHKPLTCRGWRCPWAGALPDEAEERLSTLHNRAARLGFWVDRGAKRRSVNQALRYLRQPVAEGVAKAFFRSINPPDIQWTGEVRVTRSPQGRAYRWAWSATSPRLTLILDDEGSGVYSAQFYRAGDPRPQMLADKGFVAWPALTITHAENIAKDLLAHALFHPEESRAQALVTYLLESPQFSTLKKHKVKLTPEEREQAMKAGAVWHMGSGGEPSCAIWKSVVNGQTWYGCNTHRAVQVKSTLKGAIRAFDFVKTTS